MANEKAGQKNKEVEVSPQPKGGQPLTADQLENSKKWSHLVAQAQADEKLKQRLMDNPASVLEEHGIEVPAGVEVRVVENTDQAPPCMALEARLAGGTTELTASHLSGVAGGVTERLTLNFSKVKFIY